MTQSQTTWSSQVTRTTKNEEEEDEESVPESRTTPDITKSPSASSSDSATVTTTTTTTTVPTSHVEEEEEEEEERESAETGTTSLSRARTDEEEDARPSHPEEEDDSLRPYSQPFSSTSQRRHTTRSRGEVGDSTVSSSPFESSQEIRELRKSIEQIEQSFVASRDRRMEKVMSSSSESETSSVDGDLIDKIDTMKRSIAELDRRVLDGCEGCDVAEEVDQNLERQEAIITKAIDDSSTSFPT